MNTQTIIQMKELYNSGQELKVLSVRAQEMCVNINTVLTYFLWLQVFESHKT